MNYSEISLGRQAVFLIPALKLKERGKGKVTFEQKIHKFLLEKFGGYTFRDDVKGYWKVGKKVYYGLHREYTASFKGKERIPLLKKFLAQITHDIKEQCLYIGTGEDFFLNHPKPSKQKIKK